MNTVFCTSCGKPLKEGATFCTSCGEKNTLRDTTIPKITLTPSAPTTRKTMSSKAKMLYTLAVIVIFAVFLFLFTDHLPGGAHPVIQDQPMIAMATMYMEQTLQPHPVMASVADGKISIPLSALQEYKIVEFEYQSETNVIPLLAFISAEGKLVTSIRICEPCNSKSFRIEGMELACGNCETRWKLNNLEGIQGSCQKYPPDPIPSQVVGNLIVIDEKFVKQWKMRI